MCIKESLENLVPDPRFTELQKEMLVKESNIYKITGMGSQEIKHSNTIAWFLDPSNNEEISEFFFETFISILFKNEQNDFKFNKDIKVIREREKNIDILIKSESEKFVICIENKTNADLSEGQLDKYYEYIESNYKSNGYNAKYVFLTPSGIEVPDDKSNNPKVWIPFSYKSISGIFESLLEKETIIKEERIKFIIKDYIELINKDIIKDLKLNSNDLHELYDEFKKELGILKIKLKRNNSRRKNPKFDELLLTEPYYKDKDKIEEAIYFLLECRERYISKIFFDLFKKKEKNKEIKKYSPKKYCYRFYTETMDKYLKPDNNNKGLWRNGTKYQYLILGPSAKPYILLELGHLNQEEDIKIENKILKEKKSKNKPIEVKSWEIDIDMSNYSFKDIYEHKNELYKEIDKTLEKIFEWEKTIEKHMEKH